MIYTHTFVYQINDVQHIIIWWYVVDVVYIHTYNTYCRCFSMALSNDNKCGADNIYMCDMVSIDFQMA